METLGHDPPILQRPGSLLRGIMIGGAINIAALVTGVLAAAILIGFVIIAGFGVVQLAWMLPFYRKLMRTGETETAKGVLVAAGISFLLSAACWGTILKPF